MSPRQLHVMDYEPIASRITVGPVELLQASNALLIKESQISGEAVVQFAQTVGLYAHKAVFEEFYDQVTAAESTAYPPREGLLQCASLGYVALTVTETPPQFEKAKHNINTSLERPADRHHFQARLLEEQAQYIYNDGQPRQAIKVARQAISHAKHAGSPSVVFSSRYNEARILTANGNFPEALRKLVAVRNLIDKTDPVRTIENSDYFRASIMSMQRDACVGLGKTKAAAHIQNEMYDEGYDNRDASVFIAAQALLKLMALLNQDTSQN